MWIAEKNKKLSCDLQRKIKKMSCELQRKINFHGNCREKQTIMWIAEKKNKTIICFAEIFWTWTWKRRRPSRELTRCSGPSSPPSSSREFLLSPPSPCLPEKSIASMIYIYIIPVLWIRIRPVGFRTFFVRAGSVICIPELSSFRPWKSFKFNRHFPISNWLKKIVDEYYFNSVMAWSVLRNRNYFLRFRFRLLTSYGSGSVSRPYNA